MDRHARSQRGTEPVAPALAPCDAPALPAPGLLTSEHILALQRTVGNAVVSRYLHAGRPNEAHQTTLSAGRAIAASQIRPRIITNMQQI
jgi:hypothetical protein